MAKLVDALALGASEATHEGSSPFPGTKNMETNTFFDINKLSREKGLILFGLSMNKLQNRQNVGCSDRGVGNNNFIKRIFITFFSLGILVFLLDMIIQHYWMDFVRVIFGEQNLGWYFQSDILKHTQFFVAYAPWVVLAVILIKDLTRKNFSRSISFFAGLVISYFTLIYYILSNWVDIG